MPVAPLAAPVAPVAAPVPVPKAAAPEAPKKPAASAAAAAAAPAAAASAAAAATTTTARTKAAPAPGTFGIPLPAFGAVQQLGLPALPAMNLAVNPAMLATFANNRPPQSLLNT